MAQEYIEKEIDQIFNNKDFDYPLNTAMAGAWILGNLKGINLKVLDVTKTSSLADYFVIASSTNSTQARAMASELAVQLRRHNQEPISKEGMNDSDWILLDFGDVIVHIFQELSRNVYDLENLWNEAETVKIPDHYYFSSDDAPEGSKNPSDGFDFF